MASLISKASLLMVPSTYEDGTLYNVLPSGNKAPDETGSHNGYDQTRADFSFSRGSNLAATRRNSSGLIEKGRENLLLQSNAFDTTWGDDGGTIASGFEGYDGTNNAWKYTKTGQFDGINQSGLSITGVHTISVYAKLPDGETDVDSLLFRIDYSGGNTNIVFALDDDSVPTASGNGIHAEKESVGNGWYRCSLALNQSTTKVNFRPSLGSSTSGTSGSIFIQNSQAEKGLVATDYIETGSTTAQAGILEDMPRINYDANGENGALLLESSRTNLFENSEYFGGSDWSKSNIGLFTNHSESPEGVNNASLIYPASTASGLTYIYNSTSGASGRYTISAFVKADGLNVCWLYIQSVASQGIVYFDLSDGTIQAVAGSSSTPTGSITEMSNGWYRITCTLGEDLTISSGSGIGVADAKGSTSVTKNGEDGVLVYGLQIEAASHASSYIPTHGAAVTRGADSCTGGGDSDSINSVEGVLYWECSALDDDAGTTRVLSISNGTNANSLYSGYNTTTNVVQAQLVVGGVAQTNMTHTVSDRTEFLKVAVLYKNNDHKMYINGQEVETDTSGSVPSANTFNRFNFDLGQGSFDFFGNVKQVAVFDEALSDAELVTLTT